jgi:hypothetical protein
MLIGVISGVIILLLLGDATRPNRARYSWIERIFGRRRTSGVSLIAKILALPVFWFGGPWLSTRLLGDLDWTSLLPVYLISLTATVLLIISYPLFRFILKVAGDMRE